MIIHLLFIFRFLLPKHITAITLWPFIVFRDAKDKTNARLINHERIHLRQQLELLIIPFYLVYLSEYIFLLFKYKNHDKAYRNISFEREAYDNDANLDYIAHRRTWAMWRPYS